MSYSLNHCLNVVFLFHGFLVLFVLKCCRREVDLGWDSTLLHTKPYYYCRREVDLGWDSTLLHTKHYYYCRPEVDLGWDSTD